eukprot:g3236.t1
MSATGSTLSTAANVSVGTFEGGTGHDGTHQLGVKQTQACTKKQAPIKPRNRTDPTLKYSQEKINHIVQQLTKFLPNQVSYVLSDAEGKIVYVSDAWSHMCKYDLDDIRGLSSKFLQGPLTSCDAVKGMNCNLEAGLSVKTQIINYRGNGEWFMNVCKVFPILNENNDVAFFIGFLEDISNQLKLFSSLSEFKNQQFVNFDGLRNYPHFSLHGTKLTTDFDFEKKYFVNEEEAQQALFDGGFFTYRDFNMIQGSQQADVEYPIDTPPTRMICTKELPWDLSLVCAWMQDLFRQWGFYVENSQMSESKTQMALENMLKPCGSIVAFRASKDEEYFMDAFWARKRQRRSKHHSSNRKTTSLERNFAKASDCVDSTIFGPDSEPSDEEESNDFGGYDDDDEFAHFLNTDDTAASQDDVKMEEEEGEQGGDEGSDASRSSSTDDSNKMVLVNKALQKKKKNKSKQSNNRRIKPRTSPRRKKQRQLLINVYILPPTSAEGHRVAFQRLVGSPKRVS